MMSDSDYEFHTKRVQQVVPKWISRLGLGGWHITYEFIRDFLGEHERHDANVITDWEYLQANVKFSIPAISQLDDGDLDKVVVHEFCHIIVNEMRERSRKHEERVVSSLTKIILEMNKH